MGFRFNQIKLLGFVRHSVLLLANSNYKLNANEKPDLCARNIIKIFTANFYYILTAIDVVSALRLEPKLKTDMAAHILAVSIDALGQWNILFLVKCASK